MHIITVPKDLEVASVGHMGACDYLVEDRNAAEIMLMHSDQYIRARPAFDVAKRWNNDTKRICVISVGGFGDQILLTPCLRELKRALPQARIVVSCFENYQQPFFNLPYVDGFLPYPLPAEFLASFDAVICLEDVHRRDPEIKTKHMTDLYADHCWLTQPFADKKPEMIPLPEELRWAAGVLERTPDRKRIAIQVQAGHQCRTYPGEQLQEVVALLLQRKWEVFLVGARGEFNATIAENQQFLHDLTTWNPTFRQSAAFLTTCDVVLGPDSSLIHAAGALNVPAVGLFGPFPWQLRTKYSPSVYALQGNGSCAPCFHTSHFGQLLYPADGPCARTGRCEVLKSLSPDRVVAKLEKQANASSSQEPFHEFLE